MKAFASIALAGLLIASALFGLIAWLSEVNPREPALSWTIRVASVIAFPASLAGLIYLHSRPESVPDFLAKLNNLRFGRGGVLFVFECSAKNGWAWIDVHYQNRFAKPANVTVAILPSQNFVMKRNDIEPALFTFPCGPAAYGIIHVPIALKREYQGKPQQFDVSASYDYPDGTGECLRNVVGLEMSKVDFSFSKSTAVSLARMAISGRLAGVKSQSRVKVTLPQGVAESASEVPDLVQEELWTLADNVAASASV
jgi:hypothetical protein